MLYKNYVWYHSTFLKTMMLQVMMISSVFLNRSTLWGIKSPSLELGCGRKVKVCQTLTTITSEVRWLSRLMWNSLGHSSMNNRKMVRSSSSPGFSLMRETATSGVHRIIRQHHSVAWISLWTLSNFLDFCIKFLGKSSSSSRWFHINSFLCI